MKVAQPTLVDLPARYSEMELRHLRLVWTVAEAGGLTKAAERLRLTPSALSHQLKALERIAGGALFRRDGRTMRLTAAGELLFEVAVRVLGLVASAEERLAKLNQGSAGIVRLSTHCYTGYHWLPAVIRAFHVDHPDAEVSIVAEATRRPLPALYAREIDVAITTDRPDDANVRVRPVLRDEVVLLVAPWHPLAKKPWVEPAEIAREHLLMYAERPENSVLCMEILRPAGLWPRKTTSIQLTEAIIEMVKSGLGVAALAEWAVHPHLRGGALVARRITRKGWMRTWHAVTWPESESGPLVTSFVDHVVATFAKDRASRTRRVA